MSNSHHTMIAIIRWTIPIVLLVDFGAFAVYLFYRMHMLQESFADIVIFFVALPMVVLTACLLCEHIVVEKEKRRIASRIVPITFGKARPRMQLVERGKRH